MISRVMEDYLKTIFQSAKDDEKVSTSNLAQQMTCSLCWDEESARLTKEHNNANVISIGERMVNKEDALHIVQAWLDATFQGGRHERRVNKIEVD